MEKQSYDSALYYFTQALSIRQTLPKEYDSLKAESLDNIGFVYKSRNDLRNAAEYFTRSLSIKLGIYPANLFSLAQSYVLLGSVNYALYDYHNALNYYSRAEEIYLKIGLNDSPAFLDCLFNVANLQNKLGNIQEGINKFHEIRRILESKNLTDKEYLIRVYQNLANSYFKIGEQDSASTYLSLCKNREKLVTKSDSLLYAGNLEVVANSCIIQNKTTEAEEILLLAKEYYGKLQPKNSPVLGRVFLNLANLSFNANNIENALHYIQQAVINISDGFEDTLVFNNPSIGKVSVKELSFKILVRKADILTYAFDDEKQKEKYFSTAFETYLLASELVDKIRKEIITEDSKLLLSANVGAMYENALATGYELSLLSKNGHYVESVYNLFERNKAATLLEAIKGANELKYANVPDSLLLQEMTLKKKLFEKKKELRYEYETQVDTSDARISELRDEVFSISFQLETLIKLFETNFVSYYHLKYSNSLNSFSAIQEKLKQDGLNILEYYLGSNFLYVLVLRADTIIIDRVPTPSHLNSQIEDFRKKIIAHAPSDFAEASYSLYRQLFKPFQELINENNLIIVPDGVLSAIPFEALLYEKCKKDSITYSSMKFLLSRFNISYTFSCNLLAETFSRNYSTAPSIALFAPVNFSSMNMKNLPQTSDEVRSISGIFADRGYRSCIFELGNASEYAFKNIDLKAYRYIHLATHGLIDHENSEYSKIILGRDSANVEDGELNVGEIYNMKFRADLITISACETGMGKLVSGEGIISFPRSFIFAGVSNLLVSLWSVDDEATRYIMTSFYDTLMKGKPKSVALHNAKIELAAQTGKVRFDVCDPYYWSPFILIGY